MQFGGLMALNRVSLAVAPGEIRAVIGPNGAGKSTLFNCLTGVLRPTAGRILLDGRDVTGLPPHALSHRGIARSYQITNILPGATVLENVRIAAQSRRHGWSLWRHHLALRRPRGAKPARAGGGRVSTTRKKSWPRTSRTASSGTSRSASRSPPSRGSCAWTSRRRA